MTNIHSPLSVNKIKYIQSLRQKKFRQKYGSFIVEGEKMASELLQSKDIAIEHLFATPTWLKDHSDAIHSTSFPVTPITEKELSSISALTTPNKVLVIVKSHQPTLDRETITTHFSLFLDGVQDPGNMGTILRIADWFSIPYIFCADSCVDLLNPKVIQASMGAFLRTKCMEISFSDLKNEFPALPIYGAVLEGINIYGIQHPPKGIIVMGNEGAGISEDILLQLDHKITIPGGGGAESLNVAIATGIIVSAFMNI